MTDRIQEIAMVPEPETRRARYRQLDQRVGKGDKLSPAEVESLLNQLSSESVPAVRPFLWRMVMRQDCEPRLAASMFEWLRNPSSQDRHMALRFLRECYPDHCAEWGQKYWGDAETLVRYEAALCLFGMKPREVVAALIDVFSDLPLHLQEEAEHYILSGAGSEELNRVRLNAKLRPEGPYANLAAALEEKLKTQ